MAASLRVMRRGGSGRRAAPATSWARSAAKVMSRSGFPAIARKVPATARFRGSLGGSRFGFEGPEFDAMGQLNATLTELSGRSWPKQRW